MSPLQHLSSSNKYSNHFLVVGRFSKLCFYSAFYQTTNVYWQQSDNIFVTHITQAQQLSTVKSDLTLLLLHFAFKPSFFFWRIIFVSCNIYFYQYVIYFPNGITQQSTFVCFKKNPYLLNNMCLIKQPTCKPYTQF